MHVQNPPKKQKGKQERTHPHPPHLGFFQRLDLICLLCFWALLSKWSSKTLPQAFCLF
jgi:hypothetical protein